MRNAIKLKSDEKIDLYSMFVCHSLCLYFSLFIKIYRTLQFCMQCLCRFRTYLFWGKSAGAKPKNLVPKNKIPQIFEKIYRRKCTEDTVGKNPWKRFWEKLDRNFEKLLWADIVETNLVMKVNIGKDNLWELKSRACTCAIKERVIPRNSA